MRKSPSELIHLLNDAMKTISSQKKGEEIAQTLERFIADFTQSDVAEVLLYDMNENRFIAPVSGKSYSMIDPKGLTGKHFLTKKGGIYNHMISEKGFDASIDNPFEKKHRALILYPVVKEDRLIGLIRGWRKVGNRMTYSPIDIEILSSINDFLAKILQIIASGDAAPHQEKVLDEQTLREVSNTAQKNSQPPALDQALIEFSQAVHDIRTPATTLTGFLELLEDSIDDKHLKEYIKNALGSAKFINDLTTSILDRIKFSHNADQLSLDPVPSLKFFSDIANGFSAMMEEKNITYIIYLDPNLPRELLLDSMRTRRVLNNLLSNAYKFTPEGKSVRFAVTYDQVSEKLLFEITDEGIGIDPERQKEIFDAFKQAEDDTYEKYGGTGLGLAICARYVEEMGGELNLKSSPEKGSKFSFFIPVQVSDSEASLLPFIDVNKHAVIFTNDFAAPDAINVRDYLLASGLPFERISITNQILQTPTHAYCFPDISSVELIKTLQESNVKVLLFEDHLFSLSQEKNYEDIPIISRNTYYGKAVHDLAFSLPKRRALIIDDNKINLILLRSMLEKEYIDIETSMEGNDAFEKLSQALEAGKPYDIILIDKHMPGLSGDEILRRYRELEKTYGKHAYAIYITGDPHIRPEERALFDYCMSKPFGKRTVETTLQEAIKSLEKR